MTVFFRKYLLMVPWYLGTYYDISIYNNYTDSSRYTHNTVSRIVMFKFLGVPIQSLIKSKSYNINRYVNNLHFTIQKSEYKDT